MWEPLAPLRRLDHLAGLLQQPLPVAPPRSGRTPSGIGPLPDVPNHMAVVQSSVHGNHSYDLEFDRVAKGQKTSEQWRGFPKDFFSEYNEEVCKMGHIMRK
mmetsp:Transcript_88350/g.229221  ORF Transcript_88350/g.229221 Transcript_88350/m.229221 type:complete len:101 (-) Transcript_88350:79-381(-)